MANYYNFPAPKAHLVLFLVSLSPFYVYIPYQVQLVVLSLVTVYAGSWRTIKAKGSKPIEQLSSQDAATFPLYASAFLVGLYVVVLYISKDLVKYVLKTYFMAIGLFAVSSSVAPFVRELFNETYQTKSLLKFKTDKLKFLIGETLDVDMRIHHIFSAIIGALVSLWYVRTDFWYANNLIGLSFCLQGIETLQIGSVYVGSILLGLLFFYDIFWVFFTPVMLTVAKGIDGPIKLLFPHKWFWSLVQDQQQPSSSGTSIIGKNVTNILNSGESSGNNINIPNSNTTSSMVGDIIANITSADSSAFNVSGKSSAVSNISSGDVGKGGKGLKQFSMLGLGDIVLPGVFLAMLLRYDFNNNFRSQYFQWAFWAYGIGLATTIIFMEIFNHGQPALLYIVPCVLGATYIQALLKKEFRQVFFHEESPPMDPKEKSQVKKSN